MELQAKRAVLGFGGIGAVAGGGGNEIRSKMVDERPLRNLRLANYL
jgi:hypothetical protein